MNAKIFEEWLSKYGGSFAPVVPFQKGDKLIQLDFTDENKDLTGEILCNTGLFSSYVTGKLRAAGARYAVGGYGEYRTIYSRSRVFDDPQGLEPRRLHLGIDIWGPALVPVSSPLDGTVHSFAFNNAFGDFGATIILEHQVNGMVFHTLYGHLNLDSISNIEEGDPVKKGKVIAAFGKPEENGQWPPHLHFQVILDMQKKRGDYLGVCRYSEKDFYLDNCPDPDIFLGMMKEVS
jgi:murein DD-endopeptidase MepM/ murein hydrolase activator NlpD